MPKSQYLLDTYTTLPYNLFRSRDALEAHMSTSGEMVADREIEHADDKHHRSTLQSKIDQIVRYIHQEARRTGKSTSEIKCPFRTDWNQLAVGRNPELPSTAVLMLCADEDIHGVARNRRRLGQLRRYVKGPVKNYGPYQLAYFSLAQEQLS